MNHFKKIKLERNTELDYGIRNYLNPYKGIQGILKHLYSDFIVHEVDVNGHVASLHESLPVEPPPGSDSSRDTMLVREDAVKEILNIFSNDFKPLITTLLADNQVSDNEMHENEIRQVISEPVKIKAKRTEIHKITKFYFTDIETSTKDDAIVFTKRKITDKRDTRVNWKEKGGEYLEFSMKKENKDTLEAIDLICARIKRPNKTFNFAGTKDKRGITIQKVSGFKVLKEELLQSLVGLHGVNVGDFKYRTRKIELGELQGNRFSIILRNIENFEEESVEFSRENGFINYYGMQRFGTHSIPTFAAGILLLKGQWEEAIELILKNKEEDNEKIKEARKVWVEEKDAKKAARLFPRRCVAERSILGFFAKTNRTSDLLGAIISIPRNLRLLYVHAYQSWVWNEMASERIRIYGNKLQIGDLVDTSAHTSDQSLIATEEQSLKNRAKGFKEDKHSHIIRLTKNEELEKYSIEDLVLPLPGYDVLYPQNEMMNSYKKFMEVHGFDPNNMKRKQKDFSLPGSYRKVIVRPKDYEFKLVRYDDPDQEIHISDESKAESLHDGKYLALVLQFTLPTSSYATMCLREVLKSDTSSVYHHELSKATKLGANTDSMSDTIVGDCSVGDDNQMLDADQ